MSDNLRRSTRRNKKRCYSVGDLVEVENPSGISKGRLVSKLTEDVDPKARWLVSFVDESTPTEEDVFESSLGEILGKATEEGHSKQKVSLLPPVLPTAKPHTSSARNQRTNGMVHKDTSTQSHNATTGNSSGGSPTGTITSSGSSQSKSDIGTAKAPVVASGADGSKKKNGTKQKITAAAAQQLVASSQVDTAPSDSSTTPSDATGSKKAARASAREERSKRRQALLEIEASIPESRPVMGYNNNNNTSKTTTSGSGYHRPNKKQKKTIGVGSSDEVVKIQLLTGTLILYKGLHRRAEFVRKL